MKSIFYLFVFGLTLNQAPAVTVIAGGNETDLTRAFGLDFTQGFDFTPTSNGSLTDLGLWDDSSNGMNGRFAVGLWDGATKALLASVLIDDSDALDLSLTIAGGQYRYETLGAPIALTGGNTYTLGFFLSRALSSDESLFLTPLVAGPGLSIGTYSRFEAGSGLQFPEGIFTGHQIGNVNAKISGSQSVPDGGASIALLALSLVGLAGVKRWERKQGP